MQLKKRGWLKVSILLITLFITTGLFANPVLNNVASGNVSFQSGPSTLTINQTTDKAIINWQSFNIAGNESTHFQQPAGGIALNRISAAQGPSQIYGHLTATGEIILTNSAGIFFGPGSYVNVGGLIATTSTISDSDFLSGNYQFVKDNSYNGTPGTITNQGELIAANNGLIALVGNQVENDGLIQANLGHVVLASGSAFTMSFAGNDLLNFSVDAPAAAASVKNTGAIYANGGQILVTAKGAAGVLDNVIDMQGVAQAQSVGVQNGEIILAGDTSGGVVRVAGKLDASGRSAGQTGGNVTITGYDLLLDDNSVIDVSGDVGGGTVNIGGNAHGIGSLPHANAVVVAPSAQIYADALGNGDGGNIVLWSDNYTNVSGGILSAQGGSLGGNGGMIETSSHGLLDVGNVLVNAGAPVGTAGEWLLDPTANVTISNGVATIAQTGNTFAPTTTAGIINNVALGTALAANNILVTTTCSGAGCPGVGTITVDNPVTWATGTTLTLQATDGNIIFNTANAVTSAIGNLTLEGGPGTNVTFNPGSSITVNNLMLQQETLSGLNNSTVGTVQLDPNSKLIFNSASPTLFTGSIAGTGVLEQAGSGILTLTGNNIGFTGLTQIDPATTLQLGNNTSNGIIGSSIVNDDLGNLIFNLSSTNTFAGAINGNSGGTVTKNGSGTLSFTGANTYTGTTTINSGILAADAVNTLAVFSDVIMSNAAELDINANNQIDSLSGGGNVHLAAGAILHIGTVNNIQTIYSGLISGAGGIRYEGAFGVGSLTLTNTNTYTGSTILDDGLLIAGNAINPFGTGALTLVDGTLEANVNTSLSNNSFNVISAPSIGGSNNITILNNSGGTLSAGSTLTINSTATTTINGSLNGTGTIQENSGTLVLAGDNSAYTGIPTINPGAILQLGNAIGSPTITDNGSLVFDLTSPINFASSIIGTGTLTQNGSGTVSLSSGTSSYTGGSTINAGTIVADSNNALGNGTTNINSNGTLTINNFNLNQTVIMNGGQLIGNGIAAELTGAITLLQDAAISSNAGSNFTLSGPIDGGQALVLNGLGVFTLNGTVGGAAPLNTITAETPLNLGASITTTGNQTYQGLVTLNSNATLTTSGNGNPLTLSILNGISGGAFDLNLVGAPNSTETFSVAGPLTLAGMSVAGDPTGSNTFSLDTGTTQTWTVAGLRNGNFDASNVTGASYTNIDHLIGGSAADNFTLTAPSTTSLNGGGGTNTLTGMNVNNTWNITASNAGNVSSGNTFTNMQNLVGGSANDTFTIANGGSLSGFINGSGGTNSITDNNINTTWNLIGTNSASSTSHLGDGFINIENLTGGPGADTFNFADGANITGLIDGADLANANTLNFVPYSSFITAHIVTVDSGFITNSVGNTIANYTNINFLFGNPALETLNPILIPQAKLPFLTLFTPFSGLLGDPLMYSGFFLPGFVLPISPVALLPPNVFNILLAPQSPSPYWFVLNEEVPVNLDVLVIDAEIQYLEDLRKLTINPNCS